MTSIKRILYLFAIIALLAMSPGGGADQANFPDIYIDGASGGDGSLATPYSDFASINWTTGGDNSVYDAVAAGKDVTINLKRGVTWREQMTVGASGSAAHPITVQAYGEGADPIINGADVVGTWSEASDWRTAWTGDEAGEWTIHGARNYREVLPAGTSSYDGTKVRFTVKAADAEAGAISGLSIGLMTSNDDFNVAPTRITFDSANTKALGAGASDVSDEILFDFDKTKRYGFHLYTTDRDLKRSSVGETQYWDDASSGDQTMVQVGIGATGNAEITGTVKLEVFSELTNVWQATVTTEPTRVWFDGILGALQASAIACTGAGHWYWAANVLYIYYTEDPDGAVVIEAGARDYCIRITAKNYITVDGLSLLQSDGQRNFYANSGTYTVVQDVTSTQSDYEGIFLLENPNSTVQDCTTYGNDTSGITLKECADSLIQRNVSYSNGAKGIDVEADSGDDNAADNIIQHNETYSNGREGIDIDYADRAIIRYNIVYDNDQDGAGVPGISIGVGSDACQIYYNIIYSNAENGITVEQGGGNNEDGFIYNNVFYANGTRNIYIKADGWTVKNNISMNPTDYHISIPGGIGLSTLTSDYNLFYPDTGTKFAWLGSAYNFTDWKTNSSQDAHSIAADPLMTDPGNDDFTLQVGSPCINRGTFVGLLLDYLGLPVPIGHRPDIGAYEHKNGGAVIH